MAPILVLGAGSWGTALSIHLASNHNDVWLWSHEESIVQSLLTQKENTQFLPGFPLDDSITPTGELETFFKQYGHEPHDVMLAIPSFVFDEVLDKLEPFKNANTRLLWVTKGLSEQGGLLHEHVVSRGYQSYGLLSGPSFATEVAKRMPTSVALATTDSTFSQDMVKRFHSPYFRVYQSSDLIGVQLGGALKNVVAIAVSLVEGLGFGMNAVAAMMTRGLYELSQLAQAMGAQPNTLFGLSGMGDIVLTCSDNQSRNRRFGQYLAQGMDADSAEKKVSQVVEGRRNALQAHQLFSQYQVKAPVCEMVYKILYEGVQTRQAIDEFFHLPAASEF